MLTVDALFTLARTAAKYWKWVLSGVVIATLCIALWSTRGLLATSRAKEATVQLSLEKERAAHRGTVANYEAAALQARLQDAADKQRIEGEQSDINKKVVADYETRIDDIRERFARLVRRAQGDAEIDSGSLASAAMSGVPDATQKADDAAKACEVSAQLTLAERRDAEETAEQLAALQQWVKQQAAIDREGAAQ